MKSLRLKNNLISLETPVIMGILNITEDSFYDGGRYVSETDILKRVEQILEEGATIIDLGAVSTNPNARETDENHEFESIKKNLRLILSHFPNAYISVDTFRSKVAEIAIEEGAAMINDISGGEDPNMFDIICKYKVPYILTHNNRNYPLKTKELIPKMLNFFGNTVEKIVSRGITDIIIDPGFGFGKTVEQNYYLVKHLQTFSILDFPILVGVSRKSMISVVLGNSSAESITGTITLNTLSLCHGALIMRVHDVKQCAEIIKLLNLINSL
ncbi:MAG: dihydropteroate synthase [Bacteroidales bacterium]|jgi:dihydropteroate synthase|nr:dihydropteroate synthase [Bacteroidales bacterium]